MKREKVLYVHAATRYSLWRPSSASGGCAHPCQQHLVVKGHAAARQSLLRAPVLHVGASYLRAHTITTAFKQARTGALLLSFRFGRDSQISLASGGEAHSLPFLQHTAATVCSVGSSSSASMLGSNGPRERRGQASHGFLPMEVASARQRRRHRLSDMRLHRHRHRELSDQNPGVISAPATQRRQSAPPPFLN